VAEGASDAGDRDHAGIRVVAFAGSLRKGSFNRALLRAARELAPEVMTIEPIEIGQLPFYNADVEAEGDRPTVAAFKSRLGDADGVLIATPEYNDGIPGVLTNAIDWGSDSPVVRHSRRSPWLSWGRRRARSAPRERSSTSGSSSATCAPGRSRRPNSWWRTPTRSSTRSCGSPTRARAAYWPRCSSASPAGSRWIAREQAAEYGSVLTTPMSAYRKA
jgi:hypothetical protein